MQVIQAETNLRPQDQFYNPKNYTLRPENDAYYCKFKVAAPKASGVYRFMINGEVVYIGRAKCLHNRLSIQYGTVSPRHPYKGGQIQKCRINAKINHSICNGDEVIVAWEVRTDYVSHERRLLQDLARLPSWNIRG